MPAFAASTETEAADGHIDAAVRRYLDGVNDGHALFQALYDDILDEPIPASMLALIRARH
jgi:hypothetical protein